MPIHDEYARITPFELSLPDLEFAEERFRLVEEEIRKRGFTVSEPGEFALLSEAGAILRETRGEGEDPQLIQQHGILLFHTYQFWREDHPLFLLEGDVVRFLGRTGPDEGEWTATLPASAGYVQLPQHLVWVPGSEEAPAESVDGFFWACPDKGSFSVLVVLGIRKDRPGVAVVPLPALPLDAATPWASLQVREEGEDFSSSLPGAELEGLLSLEAGAEVLKLVMRVFWYLDSFPERVATEPSQAHEGRDPTPSVFSFRRAVAEPPDSTAASS